MRKLSIAFLLALLVSVLLVSSAAYAETDTDAACWGQATQVFAKTGEMGYHASQQPNPRLGLGNLARALYEDGMIDDDSLQALGVWVAAELGLSVDACQ